MVATTLGRILGTLCVKAGIATECTSTDYFYALDNVIREVGPLIKQSDIIYVCGHSVFFDILNEMLRKKFLPDLVHVNKIEDVPVLSGAKKMTLEIMQSNEISLSAGDIRAKLQNADVIVLNTSISAINRNPFEYWRLLGHLRSMNFSNFRFLGGSRESYWQPVQDYACLALIAGKYTMNGGRHNT
jgi:hypothetical protein